MYVGPNLGSTRRSSVFFVGCTTHEFGTDVLIFYRPGDKINYKLAAMRVISRIDFALNFVLTFKRDGLFIRIVALFCPVFYTSQLWICRNLELQMVQNYLCYL